MVKASELRIGNRVYYHMVDEYQDPTEWNEVNVIDAQDLVWLSENENDGVYLPIPLTEDWLVKAGFEKDTEIMFHICSNNNHLIYIYFEKSRNCYAMIYNGSQFCVVEFVHQLQNLYFALTGVELIFSENKKHQ